MGHIVNLTLYLRLENKEYKSESEDWKSRHIDKYCKLPKMFRNLIHHLKLGSMNSHVQQFSSLRDCSLMAWVCITINMTWLKRTPNISWACSVTGGIYLVYYFVTIRGSVANLTSNDCDVECCKIFIKIVFPPKKSALRGISLKSQPTQLRTFILSTSNNIWGKLFKKLMSYDQTP